MLLNLLLKLFSSNKEPKVKASDYDLDYDHALLREKCNQEMVERDHYCTYKEPDRSARNRMWYTKPKIFNTLDYDLDKGERKVKYENYDYVICEKCNQEINKKYYRCTYCYFKEIDRNERNRMKYGLNFEIFKTSDYDLGKDERKAKYKDFDHVLCEECNQKIDRWCYYCTNCYYKETDLNERNRIKYGSKIEIFKTSDYDLDFDEREIKYKDYALVSCEKCNQKIGWRYYCTDCYDKETDINERNHMKYGSKVKILEISDYDLNLEERNLKYIDSILLCEKCNHEINKLNYYCIGCFSKETDGDERNRMKYGSKKFKIFKTLDYDLDKNERKSKYKDYNHILCEKCNREIIKWYGYCIDCYDHETDINERNRMKYGSKS
jgi:hypothetical protein